MQKMATFNDPVRYCFGQTVKRLVLITLSKLGTLNAIEVTRLRKRFILRNDSMKCLPKPKNSNKICNSKGRLKSEVTAFYGIEMEDVS